MATSLYDSKVAGEELIYRHGLFGFYSIFLDKEEERYHLKSFQRCVESAMEFSTAVGEGKGVRVHSEGLRWCAQCVEDDLEKYGMGVWRVTHQLEPVRTCLEHGTLLLSNCRFCSSPASSYLFRLKPPGSCCSNCNFNYWEATSHRPSSGYHDFVEMFRISRIRQGTSGLFRYSARQEFMSIVRATLRTDETATDDRYSRFLKYWSCGDIAELMEILGCEVKLKSLGNLLRGTSVRCHCYLYVSVLMFLMREMGLDPFSEFPQEMRIGSRFSLWSDPLEERVIRDFGAAFVERLRALSSERGIAWEPILLALDGTPFRALSRQHHVSQREVKALAQLLRDVGHTVDFKWPAGMDAEPQAIRAMCHSQKIALYRSRLDWVISNGAHTRGLVYAAHPFLGIWFCREDHAYWLSKFS